MQQTRRELLDDLLDFMGESGDADARNSAERVLNRAIQQIWLKKEWTDHRMPTPVSFSTVANQRGYALPEHFGRVAGRRREIFNLTLGDEIEPIDQDDLRRDHPEQGTTFENAAAPSFYFVGGTQGVSVQPASTGEALEVVSDNGADATIRVTIEGEDAAGVWQHKKVILTGVAPVAVGTWRTVINFSKAYPEAQEPTTEGTSSEGSVTLRKVAGAVGLETLLPEESAHELLTLTLFQVPDAVYAIAVPFIRAPKRLIYDSDELPRMWGPAVFEEARLEWDLNQGNVTLAQFQVTARPQLKALIEYDNAIAYANLRIDPFTL